MMANDDKIKIDAKEFARLIVGTNPQREGEDDIKYIKRELRLYLEALIIIDDFNDLEETRFDVAKTEQRDKILEKIMEHRY
ncbi:MAG: hypothetical protein WAW04_06115 [Paucilactobacillus nenjiangensis]|uniref:Uncharacterized protein n=2 Tax=Paucilactobacillus nenjiangensis TaxID=1296540 RepID=A0A5P1X6N2_9LACO|nr:hypothetical protein [Paucilactobacillus nenjiangensis]QER68329.1 hypothetical protein F0161_02100 [Paucilactobacillus nenjiangensis]